MIKANGVKRVSVVKCFDCARSFDEFTTTMVLILTGKLICLSCAREKAEAGAPSN